MLDYKELLKKYINHIGNTEGTTYLLDSYNGFMGPNFTDEEWAELQKLDQEVFPETD